MGLSAVFSSFLSMAGIGTAPDPFEYAIIMSARMPRTLLAVLAGVGLSVSGAALQGCFRNPLVGPQTIGVLAGAGFGGSLMLFLAQGPFWVTIGAFVGGLGSTIFVVWLAGRIGQSSVLMLVLAGIITGALFAALTTMLQYLADSERQLPQLVFWLMGSFSRVNFIDLRLVIVPILAGSFILYCFALHLNVLSCGEEEARALGIPVERDRITIICVVAAICASIVAVAGIIGWVGLVVPHIARMIVGPDHRKLLPASACIGAIFVVVVDTLCRSLTAAELPIGAITAIAGAPLFIIILAKTHVCGWRTD